MDDRDKRQFKKSVSAFLYSLNGTHSPSDTVLIHYWNALKPFDLQVVEAAFEQLASNSTGHVPPAAVVEKITGKSANSAKREFDLMLALVRKRGVSGAGEHVDQDSIAWKAINKIGGLQVLNTYDVSAIRSSFYDAYDRLNSEPEPKRAK